MPKGFYKINAVDQQYKLNGEGGDYRCDPSQDLIVLSGWIDMQDQLYHYEL